MRKSSKARLFSTCLTGAILVAAAPAWGQTSDPAPTWKPRAEVDAQVGENIGVSTSLFAPIAQNDSALVYVDGRIGYDQRFDRNGSATVGARIRTSEDTAIGVNVGADFYRSDIGSRDQAAVSMGLEGFTSVFDVRVNYRLPLSKVQTIGFIDPNAATAGALVMENNRLIERRSGFRLEAIPLHGFSGEAGVRLPVGDNASIRGSVGGFDYSDDKADQNYRGYRVGLEMDVEDAGSGARFTFGGALEHDDRFGTDARATVRLSVPFGGRASDRGAVPTGLDRQMGDRVRRDYMARSGSRYRDLTSNRFAVDARTGNEFGGFYYTSGAGVAGAAGTLAAPTTIADAVTRAGTNGVVVALGNAGSIVTPGVTLATDQYLVGGASTVDVRLGNGSAVQYALGGTNGVVVGTNAAGATVTLGQGSVVRDVTVRGAGTGIAASGVGGFALDRVTIEDTGGVGLSLTNTLGPVALTGLTIRGGAGAGVRINGGSSVSLANSTISGGAGAVDIDDGGANLSTSLSNLTLSATGGNVLDIDGSGAGTVTVTGMSGITIRGGTGETGGLSVRSATFDANTTTTGIQTVNAGRMEVGTTAARVNGAGVFLTDVTGSLSFADLDIANSGGTGLQVANAKVNSFTLATLDGTIDTVGGTAMDLDPLVINLNFAGVSSAGAAGSGVILDTVDGGGTGGHAMTIGTLTISNSGGDGVVLLDTNGIIRINGGTITGSGASSVRIGEQGVAGSGGTLNLVFAGSITDTAGAAPIVAIFSTGGTVSFTGPITGSGGIAVQDTLAGLTIGFGAITLTGTVGDAITLDGLAGSINFGGLVTIANPGANGIVIGSVPGGVTFGDVDITGLGNFNGLDVRGTQGNVLFNTLDITGTGSGTGINLTGSTNSSNVIVLTGSVIQGVAIGVDLTQANMTGQFRFGDGDAGVMNSRITATVPIVIELMNASHGSYNFADVVLQGDTTNLTGAGFTAYYAKVGATGVGSRNDPGSLAGAETSGAQYIVLLNDAAGGQDVFDATSAGGSFDLAAGQSLVSFLNGDFVAVSSGGMPANLIVTGIGPAGITNVYAGSGAAALTTSTAGAATVNLASNSTLDGLVIRNAGGDLGVEGVGVSNARILNSDIAGVTGAIAISDGGVASSVQLTHLDLASTAGTTLSLSGTGAGTLSVSAADVDIAATGTGAALSMVDVTSGGIAFGSVSTGTSATSAVSIQNVSGGALSFGSIAVGGTVTGEGVAIGGSASAVTVGSISVGGSDGDAVQLANNSGAVSIGSIDATVSGTNGNGLFVSGGGDVAIGTLTVSGGDVGFAIDHSLGAITIGGGSITGADYGIALDGVEAGSSVTIGAIAIDPVFDGIGLEGIDGSVTFTGTTDISGVGRAGIVLGAGSDGTITFGDVDITGLGANTTGVDATNASGTISFNTLDITGSSTTGTRGIDLTGASFATSLTTAESGSITGVGIGIDLTNAAITGSFRYGDGSNTDADGAASSISAVTPIVITGVDAATGGYNFLDVALSGDTSALTSSSTLYFVKAGATGAGTMADPGSLAGAEASGMSTIILLNDSAGGQDLIDAAGAGGSLDLAVGQTLLSFLGGDTLLLPGGAPANLLLYGVPQGQITNPYAGSGAPILTTTVAGTSTVVLGGANTIAGVVIQTGVAGSYGVSGSGVANIIIRNSEISGDSGAIRLDDGAVAANVALRNLRLGSSSGDVLALSGAGGGSLTVTALSGITIDGGNGETGGLIADQVTFDADLATAGTQAVVGSLSVGSAGARVDGEGVYITSSLGSFDLTRLDVFTANHVGVTLDGAMGLAAIVRTGTLDTSGDFALVATDMAMTLNFSSVTSTDGGIFVLNGATAEAGQPVLDVGTLTITDGGLTLDGSGDYQFANASITHDIDIAIALGGSVNLDYSGDITTGVGASATVVAFSHTGNVTFRDGTIDVAGGDGLQFNDADGVYDFTGTTRLHGGDAGINVASGSSGTFTFGAGTSVTDGAVANFVLQDSDADVTYLGSLSQSLNTDNFVVFNQSGGTLDFSQATIGATAGTGLLFLGADGTTTLGDVQLSGGAGITVGGSTGTLGFGNVDITGVGANQIAVDLTGATGNVTFQTLDITGTSAAGSVGIDLTGSTTAANIIVTESSAITGVAIGVDLTNAAITGGFRYGDGSSTDADGAASAISAGVPIEIAGLNGAVGSYNFADVQLTGDTSRLVTSATTYFVAAGASGAGTMADPGNLAGAELSGAQIIVLLNDPAGGLDVLDAIDAGGSFDLVSGQSLLGFLNGDTLTLPAGGPANLILFGLTPGQIVNPFAGSGAPLLTNSAAGNTVTLASNTLVDGVLIDSSSGAGISALGAANVTIRNSWVSGNQNAILLNDNGANASAALTNLRLAASNGAVIDLIGTGPGTLTLTALDDITIIGGNGETFGIRASNVTFDADLATAGFQTVAGTLQIGSTGARIDGSGIQIQNSDGDADFDFDIVTDGGSGLYVSGAGGGLRFGGTGGTIDAANVAGGYGLYLQDVSADLSLDWVRLSGASTGVAIQNVTGVGAGGNALDVSELTVAAGAAGAITMTGSASGLYTFGQSSSIDTTTGSAITLSNSGSAAFTYNGDINFAGANALLSVSGGHSGTVTFALGTLTAISGTGLVFDNADGTYNFSSTANLSAGIGIGNGSSGNFTFSNIALTTPVAGAAVDIQDSTASFAYSGSINYASAGSPAISIRNHSGGTISFDGGPLDIAGANGLHFDNADGTYQFNGVANINANVIGINIAGGSSGSFSFGPAIAVTSAGVPAIDVWNSTANVDFSGSISASGGNSVNVLDHSGGTLDFTLATLDLAGGATLRFNNADGSYDFGDFATTGGSGIAIANGSAGAFTFGNVDIGGLGTGQTAVDLTGATGNVTFQTLDISGTAGTGIDLTGSTTAANIIVTESSAITGVNIGVDLTNAAITGTFRYGDGSSTDADGAASAISAVTPIVIGGLNPGVGTYDFADVVLTGDTSSLQTNKSVFWVQAGATGAGTRSDPGSLAAAEASGVDVIILLDSQIAGQDVLDASSTGGNLGLSANQSLLGFRDGDTLTIGGGAPANLLLFGLAGGTVTNPYAGSGAPLLTTTLPGGTTVNLASGTLIDGLVIGNLDWKGVYGGYLTDVTIRNSTIHGGVNAIEIVGNGGTAALSNLDLSSTTGDVLILRGDGGDLTVTQFADLTIQGGNLGRGLFGEQLIFDADTATGGIQTVTGALTIGSAASRVGGSGLVLNGVSGGLELATTVYNTNGDGIFADGAAGGLALTITGGMIDTGLVTTGGSALNLSNLSADIQLTSITYAGIDSGVNILDVTGIGPADRLLEIGTLTVASGASSGIFVGGTTSGSFDFGSGSSITGTTVAGIELANSGTGNFDYRGDVTDITTGALVRVSSGDIGTTTFYGTLSATGGTGLGFNNADGSYDFATATVTLNGGDAGIDIVNGSDGSFTFGAGTSITSPTGTGIDIADSNAAFGYGGTLTYATAGQAAVNLRNHSGAAVSFTGTLNVTNGTGLQFDNADGTYGFTGTTTLNGGDAGIDIVNGSAGSFTFGTGTAITSPSGVGVYVADSTASLTYSGDIAYASNGASAYAVDIANHSVGTITFDGTINATDGFGLTFINADGTYDFTGTTTLNGGDAGISVTGGSGDLSFGAGTSVSSPNARIYISTSTASLTYSGSLTHASGVGPSLYVGDHSGGTLTFQTGTLDITSGNGLEFTNADGTYNFNGTTTLHGGDAGIDVLNGSSGSFTFGAGTAITSPTGAGIDITDSTAAFSYSGDLTYATAGQAAINVVNHATGTIAFQTGTISATNGTGVRFDNADGTYNFTGTTTLSAGSEGFRIANGSAGTFDFGAGSSVTVTMTGLALIGSAANVTYSGTLTANMPAAGEVVWVNADSSIVDLTAATLNVTNGFGLTFDNADGTYDFGSFALSGGARLSVQNGSSGVFTFGDVDITGIGANTTAVNLTGATGSVTFATLDITGTSTVNTRGINLNGNTGTGDIVVTNSSSISGVGIGVDLTNASRTGLFQYGDGESAIDVASSITATTPIAITGLAATGSYNFADVNLTGDTSALVTSAKVYYVLAGAAGTGTLSDPGSLAAAEAATADIIVLLNNPAGGRDVLDTVGTNGNDSLLLDAGQALQGFGAGNTIVLPGSAPANLILTGLTMGQITNPYAASAPTAAERAPLLTSSGAGNIVVLANNTSVDGVFVQAIAGTQAVYGSGVSGVTLSNTTLLGGGAGLYLEDGGAAASATLTNLTVSLTGNAAGINLSGTGAGTVTVSGTGNGITGTGTGNLLLLDDVVIGASGLSFGALSGASSLGVELDAVQGGTLGFGSITVGGTVGTGVLLTNSSATVNLGDVTVSGAAATGIDLDTNSGAVTIGTISISGRATGLSVAGQTNTLTIGNGTISGATTAGIVFGAGNTGTINLGNIDITALQANARGVDGRNLGAGDVTFATLDITGASSTGTRGIDLTGNTGSGDFVVANGSAIGGVGTGVDLSNAARTELFQYGDGNATPINSSISAITPLAIAGLNSGIGTYDFVDVALTGDTSSLATSATVFYVQAGATGAGTLVDPGSLAAAEAAGTDFIILLNDPTGGQDALDAVGTNGDDSLVLGVGQILRSFRDSNTIALPGGAPANVLLTGVLTGQVTNPFAASATTPITRAPILTTTGAAHTITLANNNIVDGVFVQSASGYSAVYGSGVSGVTVSNATLSGAGTALRLLDGGAAASATLTSLTLSASAGDPAVDLNGTGGGTLTIAGSGIDVSYSGGGALLAMADVTIGGANLAFGTVTAIASSDGVELGGIDGVGTLSFGSITVAGSASAGVALHDSSAIVDLGDVTVSGAATSGIALTTNSGAITIGTVDISASPIGISTSGLTAALTVGDGTIDGATTAGIVLGAGSTVALDFGNIDITALQANARGVDARNMGAGDVGFVTLDITGASTTGTRGIDLTGNAGAGDFVVANGSAISGVATGVDLTNAARTGLFQYGDGNATPLNSSISAITPLAIAGLNGGIGTYDFVDVALTGDTSSLATSATVFYVQAGATGAGTLVDPGSLAAAEAAGTDFIILLNDPTGGQDVLDAIGTNGDDSLVLGVGQTLRSFRDSNTIALPGGAPANVLLTGVMTGQVTNPFAASATTPVTRAPILTTTGATNTVTLANNSTVGGAFVQSASGFAAVYGSGVSGVTVSNATLSGSGTALRLLAGGASASATLTNLTLSASGTDAAVELSGAGAGSLTLAGSGIDVSHAGSGALLTIDDVLIDGANLGFGAVTATATGGGVDLGAIGGFGTLSFGSITVAGASAAGVSLHDSSTIVDLGDVTVSGAATTGIALTTNSGAITIGAIDISSSATGLSASGLASTLTVGSGTIDGATTAGIVIGAGSTVLLDFGNIDITALQAGARGVDARAMGGGNVYFETLDISGASAIGTVGIDLTGNTGNGAFTVNESSSITGVGIGVDLTNASRISNFRYGDGSNVDFDLAASTINATIPIVITGLNGGAGNYDFHDVTLVGDTSPLEADAFFVRLGATGVGSESNPGSLAGAQASGAAFIVLLDSQAGAGAFDTFNGPLTLADGQTLLAFRDVDSFNVASGAPANVKVFGVTTGTITNPFSGSGAPLLTSTDANGTVQLGGGATIDGAVISNTGTGAGVYANGTAGTATIRNSTISGGGAGIDIRSGAATRVVNLQNLALRNAGNNPGALLNINGTGGTLTVTGMSGLTLDTSGGETAGLIFNTVTFDSDLASAGIQAVNAGAFTIGTSGARVEGDGLSLTNVSGALTFTDIDIANNAGTGLLVANSKANNFLLTTLDGSVDTTNGTAVNLDPLAVNMTLANVSASGGAWGILLAQVEGDFTVTGAVNISNASTAGIAIEDNNGQTDALVAAFNGAVNVNNTGGTGLSLTNNTGATISFAGGGSGVDVTTTSGNGLVATGGGAISFAGSGNSISSNGGYVLRLDGVDVRTGGIAFANINASSTVNGVALNNVGTTGGTITLGAVNLNGVQVRGFDVGGTLAAALSITDLDIGLGNGAATAFDLNGAALTAAITVGDFDVSNSGAAGSSIAVDLRGLTGGQTVQLGSGSTASTIAGVDTGIWLNSATNALFTYGDGESGIDGTSTISAGTGVNAASAPATGTYNLTDVTFGSSPGLGFGVGRTWFVDSNGATGGGNGSGSDGANPMTLAAAELVLAATDVIVLVNNGQAISAAGSNGNDTLALLANTQVRGFGQGPLALTLSVPSTIQLSSTTINIADPTGNGAATLTSAAGADVITLGASGNRISGFVLDGAPGGALRGVVDNGGATGAVVNFMTIRNFNAVGGYGLEITPSTNSTIDNVAFTGNTNDLFLNAAGSTISNVTATGATGISITLNNATGTTTLTNVNISGAATGLSMTTPAGTINATNVDISGAGTSALTVSGGTASFNFDASSSIIQAAGGLTVNFTGNHTTGTFAFAGLVNATSGAGMQFNNADGTYNFTGTTTFNGGGAGIDIYNGATGTFAFGSGTSITHNVAGNALSLLSSANLTYDGTITDNNGTAVEIDAHDAGTATFNGAISSSLANASPVISVFNSNAGTITFNGQMNIASTAGVVYLSDNDGGTITFNAGGTGLDITSTTGTGIIISGGGTINVLGSGNSIATTSGTLLSISNTGATTTTANLDFASASNTGGANGILVQRTNGTLGGTVTIAGGAITSSTRGIDLDGDALSLSYGGTITTTAGRALEATARTGGTVTLSGAIEDGFGGINIATNSGGTIALSGNLNAAGAGTTGALTVTGNTGGTVNFSGATKRFNTGATTAVDLSSNTGATINFTGGGLAVTTTSGTGFNASGGGTVAVTGAGNTIQTATGRIANLNAVSGGTGGINFASLAASGTVANTAITFDNFDGSSFTVTGTTSIAGTSGATSDGIFVGNGSAAAISFGATTIVATGDDGVEVNGAGNGAVTFTSVTIDNTTGQGVEINGSDGTVSINGGTIGATNDPTSNAVLVSNGNGTATIAAALTKTTAGAVASVTGRTGGTVNLSGNITASGAVDNGISVANNTNGAINFTGQSISLTTGANTGINLANNTGATISFAPVGGGNGLDIVTTSGVALNATGGGAVIVTGAGNSIQTATGQVINLTNVSAGAGGINFASMQSTGTVTGIAVNFNNFDTVGGGAFSGGTTGIAATTGGDAIFIGNGSGAAISFGATTIGTTAGTIGGDGIEVNGSGNGAVTFASVDIDGTTAHGVNVTGAAGATGAISINGGTIGATASSAGDGVNVTGGGGTVTVAAAITKNNAGNVVEVSNHTGGIVTLSGNLSATGGLANGILLNNNSGGTITFSGATKTISTGANNAIQFTNTNGTGAAVSFSGGGLAITTSSGVGINATSTTPGAGSLAMSGTGNTVTSGTGTAVNIVNTNIAAGGATLQSVSANGGSRGIVLNNTGSAGGLIVTGSGTTVGSGGTIQNTNRGIELLNTAQVSIANLNLTSASNTGQPTGQDLTLVGANGSIYMDTVDTVVFENVDITGTISDNGITGTDVKNFQFNNGLITGAGDGANESGIEFINLTGTSSMTNSEIAFSETNSLDIINNAGTLTLTLNNVTFRDTQTVSSGGATNTNGEGGLQFRGFGSSTATIAITDSDLLRLRTQAVSVIGEDSSVITLNVLNSILDSQTDIGAGIDVNSNDTSKVYFNLIGNTIQSRGGSSVNITAFSDGTVMGRVRANTITANGSGAGGSGVRVLPQDSSTGIVEIANNSITAGAGNTSNMIDAQARFNDTRLDLTINGNTINSEAAALADINITSGSSAAGETNAVYAHILNNIIVAGGPTNVLRLRNSDNGNTNRLYLTGFVGGGAAPDGDAVATWNALGNSPGATAANINVSVVNVLPLAGTALTPTNPLP